MKTVNSKKPRIHSLLSILIVVIGVALMIFMIVVEDEPGAIPLLLIAVGAGGFFIPRFKIRSQQP